MAHRIDAEHDQEGGQAAVIRLRPATVTPLPRLRPEAESEALHPARRNAQVNRKPIWDKNNFGFWLAVCILLSLLFSIVYRALG